MAIYFKCPACKEEHRSMLIQTSTQSSFMSMSFTNNNEPCPKIGKQVVLNKKDLIWKDDKKGS